MAVVFGIHPREPGVEFNGRATKLSLRECAAGLSRAGAIHICARQVAVARARSKQARDSLILDRNVMRRGDSIFIEEQHRAAALIEHFKRLAREVDSPAAKIIQPDADIARPKLR